MDYFCICDEEMCWCSNMVDEPEKSCEECKAGNHKMEGPAG